MNFPARSLVLLASIAAGCSAPTTPGDAADVSDATRSDTSMDHVAVDHDASDVSPPTDVPGTDARGTDVPVIEDVADDVPATDSSTAGSAGCGRTGMPTG